MAKKKTGPTRVKASVGEHRRALRARLVKAQAAAQEFAAALQPGPKGARQPDWSRRAIRAVAADVALTFTDADPQDRLVLRTFEEFGLDHRDPFATRKLLVYFADALYAASKGGSKPVMRGPAGAEVVRTNKSRRKKRAS